MPSTYTLLLYHLVFATKNRQPFILKEYQDRFHEYLGGTVRGLGGISLGVGGVADHVHILVALKPTHVLSDFMRELKKISSGWIRLTFSKQKFEWQQGYAAFTVSPTRRVAIQKYIAGQEEHHRHRSFREELIELLRESGIDYDHRYLD